MIPTVGYPVWESLPNINLRRDKMRRNKKYSAVKRAYIAGIRRGKAIARKKRRRYW